MNQIHLIFRLPFIRDWAFIGPRSCLEYLGLQDDSAADNRSERVVTPWEEFDRWFRDPSALRIIHLDGHYGRRTSSAHITKALVGTHFRKRGCSCVRPTGQSSCRCGFPALSQLSLCVKPQLPVRTFDLQPLVDQCSDNSLLRLDVEFELTPDQCQVLSDALQRSAGLFLTFLAFCWSDEDLIDADARAARSLCMIDLGSRGQDRVVMPDLMAAHLRRNRVCCCCVKNSSC